MLQPPPPSSRGHVGGVQAELAGPLGVPGGHVGRQFAAAISAATSNGISSSANARARDWMAILVRQPVHRLYLQGASPGITDLD